MVSTERDSKGRFVKGNKFSPEMETKRINAMRNLSPEKEKARREKISNTMKAKGIKPKKSPEIMAKISSSLKGKMPWNNGIKTGLTPWNKGKKTGIKHDKQFKKGSTPWNKGLTDLPSAWNKGTKGVMKANKTSFKVGQMDGEKHHNWRGGISFEPYDITFNNKFKRAVRKRDNQICMLCNIHREKLKRALIVHHINYDKLLSVPQNCISLCDCCHGKTNYNRTHWTNLFQSLLNEKYNYSYKNNEIELEVIQNCIFS